MSNLTLTIKKKWFGMIVSGEKKEEYREIKDHWARRLLSFNRELEYAAYEEMICDLKSPNDRHRDVAELMEHFDIKFKHYDTVTFINGYQKSAPRATFRFKGVQVKGGCTDWGAEDGAVYFTISIGELIETKNTES